MPYTQSQLQCLRGMGLVPWVERVPATETNPTEIPDLVSEQQPQAAVAPVPEAEHDFMHTPLLAMPFRGQLCTQLGKKDSPLLILVEALSLSQSQYPFEPADAKLFDDMLRSIAWRRQDTCLGVLEPSTQSLALNDEPAAVVAQLCQTHRDVALVFRLQLPDTESVDDLAIDFNRPGLKAWQLPHPSLLRNSPQRKRQAWNVLKAARALLPSGSLVAQ
jgi:uracil-DNA glycosylase